MNNTKKQSRMMMILLAMAILPFVAAVLVYKTGWGVPEGRTNNGMLIKPTLKLEQLLLNEIKHNEKLKTPNQHTWWLLTFDDGSCEVACQQAVWKIRQINIALAKNQERVQHGLIITNDLSPNRQPFLKEYPGLVIFKTKAEMLKNWSNALPELVKNNLIMIADPLGNVMLYYTSEQNPRDILKDLNHLLKSSTIG
jgi:cytochrome oxidase Cu insertion factor (SCO1/SenC/PrrC family)